MSYYTETEGRADLAGVEVNPPEGYIGTRLFPVTPVAEKAGRVAFAKVVADSPAQTGRAVGAAPVATQIANDNREWSCAEIIDRAAISPDEVKQMGGIEKADIIGARWAMRQVLTLREKLIAAQVLSGEPLATFLPEDSRKQVHTARQELRLFPGRTALVGGAGTFVSMVQAIAATSGIGDAFARLVTGVSAAEAAIGLSFEAWRRGLALFYGVDDIIAGDDAVWADGAYSGRFAVVKLDNTNDPLSHKYIPVLGKTFTFIPSGGNGWEVQSIGDRTLINNFYDAKLWIDVEKLNDAAYLFDGVIG